MNMIKTLNELKNIQVMWEQYFRIPQITQVSSVKDLGVIKGYVVTGLDVLNVRKSTKHRPVSNYPAWNARFQTTILEKTT